MSRIETFRNDLDVFHAKVRSFVEHELGCGCPENVFEQIRVLRGEGSPGKADLALVIGERLLVLFADRSLIDPFEFEMPRLIIAGVTYRDSAGLHRFRLVFGSDLTDKERSMVETEVAKYDDRVHAHFLD